MPGQHIEDTTLHSRKKANRGKYPHQNALASGRPARLELRIHAFSSYPSPFTESQSAIGLRSGDEILMASKALTEYERRRIDQMAGWKAEPPSYLSAVLDKLTRPLVVTTEHLIP